MLILGSKVMTQSFGVQYQEAATSARRRTEAVLSGAVHEEAADLKENIRFRGPDSEVLADVPGTLQPVRRSRIARHSLYLRY